MPNKKIIIIVFLLIIATVLIFSFKLLNFSNSNEQREQESPLGQSSMNLKDNPTAKLYENFDFGFRFLYPASSTVSELEDDTGFTILVKGIEPKEEFQIFISPFDEEGELSGDRIKRDIPDLKIDQPQNVLIGDAKDINALIFLSENESVGQTREIWFSANGYLFQITAVEGNDNFIGPVMETIRIQ